METFSATQNWKHIESAIFILPAFIAPVEQNLVLVVT
jgi:hypothetical protein